MALEPGVPCMGSSPPLSNGPWAVLPTPQGMALRVGVSLHTSKMPLTWAYLELDLLQQQLEPPAEQLCPSTAQNLSLMNYKTQQCNRIKAAAKVMKPHVSLKRGDLLYW